MGMNINKEKHFNYLEKIRTKAVYRKSSKISRVAENIGTPLAAVCIGAVMNWLAMSVKETRATRAERVSMSSALLLSHFIVSLDEGK